MRALEGPGLTPLTKWAEAGPLSVRLSLTGAQAPGPARVRSGPVMSASVWVCTKGHGASAPTKPERSLRPSAVTEPRAPSRVLSNKASETSL